MAATFLKRILLFLPWYWAVGLSVLLAPPPWGLLLGGALAWALLRRFLLRAGRTGERERWATLRLRPLRGARLHWTLLAVPVLVALSWTLGEVYTRLVPVPAENFSLYEPYIGTPLGRLSLTLLAVAIAPVIEEFFFRGLLQRPLERRFGPMPAILSAAALFALVHLLPWVFPIHLFLGVVFGFATYATGSIWAGVILHAANNIAAVLGITAAGEYVMRPTIWETGADPGWWSALALLGVACIAGIWVARGLWRAGRR